MTAQEPRTTGAVWGAWCRRLVPVVVATLLLLGATMGVSRAAWGDTQALTGAGSTAYVVPPAVTTCVADNPLFGPKTATVSWTAVTAPTALSYTARVVGTGAPLTIDSDGQTRSVTLTSSTIAGLLATLGGILGGSPSTMQVEVVAGLPTTSWVSTGDLTSISRGLGGTLSCS